MIFRTVKDRDHHYVKINISAANDARLSYKGLGIHTYLMTKPDGWEAREVDLAKRHDDGVASVRSGVRELIEHGYMIRVRVINSLGQVVDWRIDTFETPDLNPHYQPDAELVPFIDEIVDAGEEATNPDRENRNVDEPDCGFPQVGFPHVGFPLVENRMRSNNRVLAINEGSDDPVDLAESGAAAPAPGGLKDHPAIRAFYDLHNRYPSTAQMKIIVERNPPLGPWVSAIRAWAAAGYKTGNVQGMLDWAFDPGRGEVKRSLFDIDRGDYTKPPTGEPRRDYRPAEYADIILGAPDPDELAELVSEDEGAP